VALFDSRKPAAELDLEAIFSVQYVCMVTNGCTFSVNSQRFHVGKENDLWGLTLSKIVEHWRDGTWRARFRGRNWRSARSPSSRQGIKFWLVLLFTQF
jgi:hypothetical protein